ncbi:MAG: GTP 3',8-cyclase MoaA [Pseudomonadota bacterium]
MGRTRYLRISVTARCNLRCRYCHREGQHPLVERSPELSPREIATATRAALEIGFDKVKLTGGEPLVRKDLEEIVRTLRGLGADNLSVITNGTLLRGRARSLREAGLPRINVSLNTLDPEAYSRDHGRPPELLHRTLAGIDAALDAGYADLKVNTVFQGEESWSHVEGVCDFAGPRGLVVVLLPMMPYGAEAACDPPTLAAVRRRLDERYGIRAAMPVVDGEGIRRERLDLENGAQILLRTEELRDRHPYPACGTCSRSRACREGIFPLRLSACGQLVFCMAGGVPELDIRAALQGSDLDGLRRVLREAAGW